jgi:hypothetical protein
MGFPLPLGAFAAFFDVAGFLLFVAFLLAFAFFAVAVSVLLVAGVSCVLMRLLLLC